MMNHLLIRLLLNKTMKFLIVGLGNPGVQYEETRHNIGFRILDQLAILSSSCFSNDKYASCCEISFKSRKLILIKPNTFMNLSGKAVNYWLQKTKLNQQRMIVVTDDISLPFGSIRLRKKGSSGGHNGLKDIQNVLGNQSYSRLRFGVGNEFSKGMQSDYVLGQFTSQENKIIEERVQEAIKVIRSFVTIGVDLTMSEFNRK